MSPPTDRIVDTYQDLADALKGPLAPLDGTPISIAPDVPAIWEATQPERFLPPDLGLPEITNVFPLSERGTSQKTFPVDTTVTATFSEAMEPTTLVKTPTDPANPTIGTSETVTLVKVTQSSEEKVVAKVEYSVSDNKVTLTPMSANLSQRKSLDFDTQYKAKVKGGKDGVKDLEDNPLAVNKVPAEELTWLFRTNPSPAPAP